MNLRFFTWIPLLCISGFLCAAPYAPEGMEVLWTQPDGTTLELRVFGDEFYARTETLGGHTVVFDESRVAYYYARRGQAGDALEPTNTPAHHAPPQGLEKHLELDNRSIAKIRSERFGADVIERNKRWQNRMKSVRMLRNGELGAPFDASPARAAAEIQAAPVSGNMVGLTLIVQFPNDSATSANDPVNFPTNKEKIERYCNTPGYSEDGNSGSIRDYFFDQSLGKLTYTQKVSELVTLPRARNYYNFSDYPNNQTLRNSAQAGTLIIQDAITQLRSQNFDFSGLTAGADNVALATNVFFAGRNSGVWARGLWPHQSGTSALVDLGPTAGGMRLSQYQITDIPDSTPEIGTFCHENGHLILDFPDLYDYGGESGGIGRHGLMASGNYSNGGRTPSPINAHFKDIVGWANVRDLAPAESVKVVLPSTGNEFVRIRKPGSSTEYFLFENRGQGDKWAQYVPDKGIAIWHVDEAVVGNNNQEMTATRHYQVSLEQADGMFQLERSNSNGDANDLYDLTVPLFSGATVPSSSWWSGAVSGVRARIESMPGSNMTVTFGDLRPNTLILNSPNGGEVLFRNSTLRIQWESNITGNVQIDLLRYGSLIRTIAGNLANTKRFDWTVPESLQIGGGYQVKISSLTNPVAVSDVSDLQFSVTPATFPAGGKMPLGWQKPKGADDGWVLTSSGAYEGKYALKSNQLGDGETAAIEYRNKFRAGTISFYMKTSTEPSSDVARFYINGKAQKLRGRAKSLSGLGGWIAVAIPIGAGTHTLMWTYEKDDSYGDGKDAVWLDGVYFPLANPEIDVKSWKGVSLASGIFSQQVGQVKVGAKPILRELKITNLGEEYLGKLKAKMTGDNAKDFKIRGLSRDVLSAGQSATLKLEFLPSKIGWKQAELVISSNDSDEGRFVVNLYGKALPKNKPKKKQKSGSKNLASSMADFSQAMVADGEVHAKVQRVIKNDVQHLSLTVQRDQIPEGFSARVEVSSDLLDWYSGSAHTTILNDNQHVFRVMDKTPITNGMKRHIRVRYIPH